MEVFIANNIKWFFIENQRKWNVAHLEYPEDIHCTVCIGKIVNPKSESESKFQYEGLSLLHKFVITVSGSSNVFGRDI